ncbi:MAG: hypothetical protein ACTHJT_06670 [Cytophaga sp.]|uniref:hypothetical protein n=1 Tax=Cytophaga sp. TaxID=29535 RepID=UPI003F80137E
MSRLENDIKTINLIISNLDNFSSRAERLLKEKRNGYPDFFDQYCDYLCYLKELHFETKEIKEHIQKAPKIPTSEFPFWKLMIILPLFLYLYIFQFYLIFFIWVFIIGGIALYFFINERRRRKMNQIMVFNSRLIDLLEKSSIV